MRPPITAFLVRFALVAALLLTWALGIGRYGGPDEPAHVLRSFAAAHGHVLGDPADPLPPGYRVVSVPASLASGDPACYRHDARLTSECASSRPDPPAAHRVRVATSAGLTPPLYHLAIGTIVRLVGDPGDTAWYRAVAALLQASVVALTLTRLRDRPRALALAVASITPAAWFLFGVVNPNSLEIALAVLGWAGVARFIDSDTPRAADAWWIAAPMALAIVVRPIALVAAVAMLIAVELRGRTVDGSRWRRRSVLVLPIAGAVAVAVGWSVVVDVQIDDPRTAVHRSIWASVGDSLGSLHITATEAVNSMGWNEFHAPAMAAVGWVVMWLAVPGLMLAGRPSLGRRGSIAVAVWLAALVATPVVFEVALAASIGPIWQGRYSLPVLMGLPVFVCLPQGRLGSGRIVCAFITGAAAIECLTYWGTVRRYAVGSNGSWWLSDAFHSTVWLGPRPWLVVHIVIVVVAASCAIRATTSRRQTM
ncbi:MAG: putative rane protein [Ilumatobacteraceae bacterium]|nr:putative rane protein [Ilumatobacteraceae bacterium]